MRGDRPTLDDIILEELVMPINLLCDEPSESLSPDCEGEEERLDPYRIESTCYICGLRVRIVVVSSSDGIRCLEQLLLEEVSLLCATCARNLHDGRPQ
uniref:Protein E7 n=1 Tax=Human papillomavirus TaxID=10566 RepID=A0A385PLW4_9PAPI|nr:MAG: E7 protein [Human papillomavirus]